MIDKKGWEKKRLNEVGQVVTGNTPKTSDNSNYSSNDFCFFKPSDLRGNNISLLSESENNISESAFKNSRNLPIGSVLVTCIGTIGNVGVTTVVSTSNQQINAIIPNKETDSRFLAYSICSIRSYLNHIANAPIVPIINKTQFSSVEIYIPPLPIQQQIVSELDTLSDIISKKKQQLADLDTLAQATFYEMFGDPVSNEKGWEMKKLGKLCNIVRGGSPRPIEKFLGGDVPWIKIGDATKGNDIYLNSTREHIIKDGVKKSRLISKESLIFANCGVSLGFARIITFEGCIHDGWLAFNNITFALDKIFLLKHLNFQTQYFRSIAPEGTQPNLNTSIMNNAKIIVPPLLLQLKFAQKIESIVNQKSLINKSLADVQHLFDYTMDRYFN